MGSLCLARVVVAVKKRGSRRAGALRDSSTRHTVRATISFATTVRELFLFGFRAFPISAGLLFRFKLCMYQARALGARNSLSRVLQLSSKNFIISLELF